MIVSMLTKNSSYGRQSHKVGVMIHSTGANNPYLKRYVPNDKYGLIGENKYNNTWNHPDVKKSVTGFVGKLNDGSVAFVQTLPLNNVCWHAGVSYTNNYFCAIEICEDNYTDYDYFLETIKCLKIAVIYIAKKAKIDLAADMALISHKEGYSLGLATNHGDPDIWWSKFNYNMNMFRAEVMEMLEAKESNWYDKYMEMAEKLGIMTNERPTDYVTRAELAVVINSLYGKLGGKL